MMGFSPKREPGKGTFLGVRYTLPIIEFASVSFFSWTCLENSKIPAVDHHFPTFSIEILLYSYSGWWFGPFLIFPYIGNVIIPTDFQSIIFQDGVGELNHQPDYSHKKWTFLQNSSPFRPFLQNSQRSRAGLSSWWAVCVYHGNPRGSDCRAAGAAHGFHLLHWNGKPFITSLYLPSGN